MRSKTLPAKPGSPESWDDCVRLIVGPRLVDEPPEIQQRNAMELAKAALRFAGESEIADSLLE